jgi:hypothetical protein
MVPGSRVNHNNGSPSAIEIKVYHFSGAQAGLYPETSSLLPATSQDPSGGVAEEGGGGCFIRSAAFGYPSERPIFLDFLSTVLIIINKSELNNTNLKNYYK